MKEIKCFLVNEFCIDFVKFIYSYTNGTFKIERWMPYILQEERV